LEGGTTELEGGREGGREGEGEGEREREAAKFYQSDETIQGIKNWNVRLGKDIPSTNLDNYTVL
jgi:hypothetical protein